MKFNFDKRIIGAWLMITFLFMLVFAANWERVGILSIIALAAYQGLVMVVNLNSGSGNHSEKIVQTLTSPDGIVTAEIKEVISKNTSPLVKSSRQYYSCWVKRTYQDGVFIDEEELDSLADAKSWLNGVYNQELKKHMQKTSAADIGK